MSCEGPPESESNSESLLGGEELKQSALQKYRTPLEPVSSEEVIDALYGEDMRARAQAIAPAALDVLSELAGSFITPANVRRGAAKDIIEMGHPRAETNLEKHLANVQTGDITIVFQTFEKDHVVGAKPVEGAPLDQPQALVDPNMEDAVLVEDVVRPEDEIEIEVDGDDAPPDPMLSLQVTNPCK